MTNSERSLYLSSLGCLGCVGTIYCDRVSGKISIITSSRIFYSLRMIVDLNAYPRSGAPATTFFFLNPTGIIINAKTIVTSCQGCLVYF